MKFPRHINRLITGRTFDLSTVHRPYLTLFEGLRRKLGDNLEWRPGGHYEASPELFSALQPILQQVADQHFPDASINAADLIAIALFRSAVLFRLPNNSRRGQLSRFRDLLDTWRRQERGGFHKLVGFPIWRDDVFSFQSGTHKSEIKVDFVCGLERGGTEPFLAVEISGDPVRDLGRALFGENNKLTRLAGQKEARKLWLAVLDKLYVMTGTISPKGGRPKEKYVVEGAFLKKFCGLSWKESAVLVCPLNHARANISRC